MTGFDANDARGRTKARAEIKADAEKVKQQLRSLLQIRLTEFYVERWVPEIKRSADAGRRDAWFFWTDIPGQVPQLGQEGIRMLEEFLKSKGFRANYVENDGSGGARRLNIKW